ncbi:MAG: GHKL domain-containing protein [Elusimicrobia bacterium]|nr:GHKL domain-containing protein [Elusimicrobiota bacterium]
MKKLLIAFIYTISIVIPGTILIFLGNFYLKHEKTLIKERYQNELIQESLNIKNAITLKSEEYLTHIEESIHKLNLSWNADNFLSVRNALNSSFFNNHLKAIFIIDASGTIRYPKLPLFKTPASLGSHPADTSPDFVSRYQQARQYEFQKNDFLQAKTEYDKLRKETNDPRWKGILGIAQSACLSKAGKLKSAEKLLQEVIRRSGRFYDDKDQPIGIVASIELGNIYKKRKLTTKYNRLMAQVLNDIFTNTWSLSPVQRELYLSQLGKFDPQVIRAEKIRLLEAEMAHAFIESTWMTIKKMVQASGRTVKPTVVKLNNLYFYIPINTIPLLNNNEGIILLVVDPLFEQTLLSSWSPNINLSRSKPDAQNIERIDTFQPPLWFNLPINRKYLREYEKKALFTWSIILSALLVVTGGILLSWRAIIKEKQVASLKARIVASVSHDVKTPLSVIAIIAQKLKLGRYKTEADLQRYYGTLNEAITRLKSIVDDVLDFSKYVDAKKSYSFQKIDLVELLQSICDSFTMHKTDIAVHESGPAYISGEVNSLVRLFNNLISNAIKYSPPDRIHITITFKKSRNSITVYIQDQGYGIHESELPCIFDQFFSGKKSREGTGLGLAIVKQIIEIHGGTIQVESSEGKGTCFTINFPEWREHGTHTAC